MGAAGGDWSVVSMGRVGLLGRASRHGRAVPAAAVEGTRAWTALGHREVPKKFLLHPLLQ